MNIDAPGDAEGSVPRWTWPTNGAVATGARDDEAVLRAKDENWAMSSGLDIGSGPEPGPGPRQRLQATAEDSHDIGDESYSERFSAASAASGDSWITEEAQTPSEHNGFHYRGGGSRDGLYDPLPPRRPTAEEEAQARYRRRYKPRTCRICFETVLPTFEDTTGGIPHPDHDMVDGEEEAVDPVGLGAAVHAVGEATAGIRGRVAGVVTSAMPGFLRSSRMPRVRYISESPEDGRLISPCRCKGSQKYVHEACLQRWRIARPMAERNYWKCPTCGFEYRMQRLRWGRLVSNKLTRAFLTLLVFLLTLFVLGFVADPLMDLWADPAGVVMDTILELGDFGPDDDLLGGLHDVLGGGGGGPGDAVQPTGWWEHFLKGLFSLGIVGVVKTFLVVSPFTWFNLRGASLGRGRRRAAGGRRGYEGISWVFILVGVFTFLGAAWKGISYVSGRFLERASDRIIDIGSDEPDDEDDEDDAAHMHAG